MIRLKSYTSTIISSYVGYIVQAIVNCFVPLLFINFTKEFNIALSQITLLVTVNFLIQLIVDVLASKLVDKIGYRISMLVAHIFAAAGLLGLAFIPDALKNHFAGLIICVVMYAVGGGLLEVCVSPIVEACPTKRKAAAMSLLHSFYCWGSVAVILISSICFMTVGVANWRYLAIGWAIVPILNAVFFMFVPLNENREREEKVKISQLLKNKIFWISMVLMLCAGAAELSMSQWASAFAESGLGVSKTVGDLLGPCLFAAFMGVARVAYAKLSDRIDLNVFMLISAVLCVIAYMLAAFAPIPALSLVGCALCGLSVGIFWPGTFSMATANIKGGGTALFALLAFAGDMGCTLGPTAVGALSGALGDNLKIGLSLSAVFPITVIICLIILMKINKADKANGNSLLKQ